jgi:tetratricopeptide (TPR) repeat protein
VHKNPVITLIVGALLGFFGGYIVGQRQPAGAPPQAAGVAAEANPHAAGSGPAMPPPAAAPPAADPKLLDQLTVVKQLLAKDPTNYAHLVQAGNLNYDLTNFASAVEYYERARAIKDDSPDVLTDLGNCYRETKQPAKALELFDKAAGMGSAHWQSRYNAAVVRLFDLNDPAGAREEVEKLKQVKPVPAGMPDLAAFEAEIARHQKQ